MKEILERHRIDVQKIMERYEKETEQFLSLADEIYVAEYSFRKNIFDLLSPESYQKGLDTYLSEYERINEILSQKEIDYKKLYDENNANNSDFSVSIQIGIDNNEYSKNDVELNIKKMEEDFDNNYGDRIKTYKDRLNEKMEKINKEVKANRKFVVEYGSLTFSPDEVVENQYKPIYDKHDEADDKLLFDFQTRALSINWIPENIKNNYSQIIKKLDGNYDIFKDIFGE